MTDMFSLQKNSAYTMTIDVKIEKRVLLSNESKREGVRMKKRIVAAALTLCMIIGSMLTGATAAGVSDDLPFADVISGKWYCEGIEYAYDNSLMNGTSDTMFEPMTQMSRAMFVTVLGRLHGAQEIESDAFSDIKQNSWYSGYVGWANESGIVEGFKDGTFKPDKAISREEAATAIVRYIEYIKMIPTREKDAPKSFTDKDSIAKWSSEYVEKLRTTGIIEGDQNQNFNPSKSLNRAEAAAILMRLHKMKTELQLEEGKTLSYKVEGEDFNLLGAWQMYYSGTALTTSYNASRVDESSSVPSLVRDDDGRKALEKRRSARLT